MYLRTCARICLEEVFIFHYFMRFVCSSIGGTKTLNLEVIEMEVFDVKVLSILADFVGILDWIGLDWCRDDACVEQHRDGEVETVEHSPTTRFSTLLAWSE